jgi:hypothetical protein
VRTVAGCDAGADTAPVTAGDIDWPPPICDACKWGFCDLCQAVPWCEHDCPTLYEETP